MNISSLYNLVLYKIKMDTLVNDQLKIIELNFTSVLKKSAFDFEQKVCRM